MNKNLSGLYGRLTTAERFALTVAAVYRGDELETARLRGAGPRIKFSGPDTTPLAVAFNEVSLMCYIELQDAGTGYLEVLQKALGDEAWASEEQVEGADADVPEPAKQKARRRKPSPAEKLLDAALFLGYLLKTKVQGWALFCEHKGIEPFVAWQELPGYLRLQHALEMAEKSAFVPEGALRYLNRRRPKDLPPWTAVPFNPDRVAAELHSLFDRVVANWKGP
jgi:hypothetical protein